MYVIIFKPRYLFCDLIWGIFVFLLIIRFCQNLGNLLLENCWNLGTPSNEWWNLGTPPSNEWQNSMHYFKLHTPRNDFKINQAEYWSWYSIDTDTMWYTLFHQNILPRSYLVVGRDHSLIIGWRTSNHGGNKTFYTRYGRRCQKYLDPSWMVGQQISTCLAELLACHGISFKRFTAIYDLFV